MAAKPIEPRPISYSELVKLFSKRIFAIPDIQREFVWNKKKITKLLDSISKHFPIGTFLICKISSNKVSKIREGVVLPPFSKKNKECYLVIDGQQRLSVLYSMIFNKPIKSQRYSYDLTADSVCLSPTVEKEDSFGFYDPEESRHVKIIDILAGSVDKAKITKRVRDCRSAFQSYSFPFIFLSKFDKDKMKEAFIRLNTGGTPLSQFDKIITEAYSKDTDLRTHINQLVEYELEYGFRDINKIHMNVFIAVAANLGVRDFVGTGLSHFAKKLANPRNDYHHDYKRYRKRIYHSIRLSADFLGGMVKDASYLPYPSMLSILSVFFYNNSNRDPSDTQISEIKRWFWITGFTERYSGAKQRDNQINDAEEMKKLAMHKYHHFNAEGRRKVEAFSIKRLIKTKYTTRSALRNTFFSYLISQKPIGFNGQPLAIEKVSSIFNSKNDHHIFPKKLLQGYGWRLDEINRVINICFLKFRDNLDARKSPPWTYLKEYRPKPYFNKLLGSHMIPTAACVLKSGDIDGKFEEFCEERKKRIESNIASLIGKKYISNE